MNAAKRAQRLAQAEQAFQAGDMGGAQRSCEQLLRANRADVRALHLLGVIASSQGDDSVATACLSRCVAIEPHNATFQNNLARVHALAGRYGPAVERLERALSLQPTNVQALTDLADVLERSGHKARALELLDPFIRAGTTDLDMAPVSMRLLDHVGQTAQAIQLGRRLLDAPGPDVAARRFLLQLLGRLHDKTGDFESAFRAFEQAKQSETHHFVPAEHSRGIDALIAAFSAARLARLPRSRLRTQLPVFIACMPRSGSTLVEQIIHAHPSAFGGGEDPRLHRALMALPARLGLGYPECIDRLDLSAVDALAGDLVRTMNLLSPSAARVTSKHLLNYLHLGMVAVLFPGARVIHVSRHPLDNGLACYMTSLSPAIMPWASELKHIGFALREHERLMAHWRQTLDLKFLDVQYEQLVEDTDAQTRRIIDFCGLPWDDHCLRYWEADRVVLTPSYDQVRRPVFHTALHRWRNYGQFLQPLKDALA
jgi:tetratricopeptide (TPR) repeat protein